MTGQRDTEQRNNNNNKRGESADVGELSPVRAVGACRHLTCKPVVYVKDLGALRLPLGQKKQFDWKLWQFSPLSIDYLKK